MPSTTCITASGVLTFMRFLVFMWPRHDLQRRIVDTPSICRFAVYKSGDNVQLSYMDGLYLPSETENHSVKKPIAVCIKLQFNCNTVIPRFTGPQFTVSSMYRAWLCSPNIRIYNQTCVNSPPIYRVPRIYRVFLLSPEKHGKSGDDCITI